MLECLRNCLAARYALPSMNAGYYYPSCHWDLPLDLQVVGCHGLAQAATAGGDKDDLKGAHDLLS